MKSQRTTTDPSQADTRQLARALLDAAIEVERAEAALKHEIIRLARAGDCRSIERLVSKWLTEPPTDILRPTRAGRRR